MASKKRLPPGAIAKALRKPRAPKPPPFSIEVETETEDDAAGVSAPKGKKSC